MNLNELARDLEAQAARVRSMAKELTLPEQDYSLEKAIQRLRAVVDSDKTVRLSLELTDYGEGLQGEPVRVEWCAWDGEKSFTAPDLAGAINRLLAAHHQPPADPLAAAEAKLEDTAMPF